MNIGYVVSGQHKRESFSYFDWEDRDVAQELASQYNLYAFTWLDLIQSTITQSYDVTNDIVRKPQRTDELDIIYLASLKDAISQREKIPGFMHELQRIGIPVVNHPANYFSLNSKDYILILQNSGIPVPKTGQIKDKGQLEEVLSSRTDNFIIKPMVGHGGIGVEMYPGGDLDVTFGLLESGQSLLVQDYLEEIKDGEKSIIFAYDEPSYAVRKVPRHFKTNELESEMIEETNILGDEVDLARKIFNIGMFIPRITRLDLVRVRNRPVVMEISANRPSLYPMIEDGISRAAGLISKVLKKEVGNCRSHRL